jgi:hypothetical protein
MCIDDGNATVTGHVAAAALRGILLCCALFALPLLLHAETVRVYLKDGSFQLAREYQVEGDRVRYYSTERGEWEELPLDLVDLKKTEGEIHARQEAEKEEKQQSAAEDKAEIEMEREIDKVPKEPGVYYVDGDAIRPVKQAESKMVTAKGRKALKLLSPLPVVSGKITVELDGAHAPTQVKGAKPEFYIRLSQEEQFALVKVTDHKGNRVVEKIEVVPVSNEEVETFNTVDLFLHQVGDMVFKFWPLKPLDPGEYAVVQYTQGKVDTQVWDFTLPGKTGS